MPPRGNLPADRLWKRRLAEGPLSAAETRAFAAFALNRVSRTFALNIRVLPGPLRAQVLHAFAALFRADLPEDEARAAFEAFPDLLPPGWKGSEDWEKILLERAPVVLRAFPAFPAPARAAIARCATEMCGGMADFARRREERAATGRPLIETLAELDEYCYYVAGTVGVMLCDLFIAHANIPPERAAKLRALCVSFGLGLQLTNILKDVRDDGARGVSWLPPGHAYAEILAKARGHLEEALEYTLLIPRRQRRLRLFCLWPLFMAAETLALLDAASRASAPAARVKISRARVARILLRTRLFYFSNTWLRAEFRRHLALPPPTGYL
jgi:farnesyl-diphosphate farnesyltransferase